MEKQSNNPTDLKEKIKSFLWMIKKSKRAKIILLSITALIVLAVLVTVAIAVHRADTTANPNTNLVQLQVNKTVDEYRRFIDGVEVAQGKENLFPVAVMIENADFGGVRPQSGLQAANVVYESLAEGGITRFMAVYASGDDIQTIGPVRSARPYYVDWAEEYKGMYVHAGGSPQGISRLAQSTAVIDLDQISGDHRFFWRDPSVRPTEHGLFTSAELLSYAILENGAGDKQGEFTPWKFQNPSKRKDRPVDPKQISIPFSTAGYAVEYRYEGESNDYLRWNGGSEHRDKLTDQPIRVKNIVVQFTDMSLLDNTSGRLNVATIGDGRAVLFHDGVAIEGRWKKQQVGDRTIFTDVNGQEMSFIPGNIWVEVIPSDRTIEYN